MRAAVALGARDGLHAAARGGGGRGVGEEDVFEGAELDQSLLADTFGSGEVGWRVYEKKCICEESVGKDGPSCPSTSTSAPVQDLRDHEGDNHAHEFVARVCHQIEQLAVIADTQNIRPKLQPQDLKHHDHESRSGRQAHDLGVESAS